MWKVTVIHNDCMRVLPLMPDKSVDFTLTDIPYNAVNRKDNGLRKLDKGSADILMFDLQEFLEEIMRVTKNSICVFCGKEQFSTVYAFFTTNKEQGTTRAIVWEKTNPSPMNGAYVYLSGVEFAVWFKRKGSKSFHARCKNTVFKYPNGRSKYHPTEKNSKLMRELILDNTNADDIVFDPCMGSGSHLLAAVENGRQAVGIEIQGTYFEIAYNSLMSYGVERKGA